MSENNIELKNNPEVNNINNNEISQMNKSDQIEYSEDEKKQIERVKKTFYLKQNNSLMIIFYKYVKVVVRMAMHVLK